jgi:hypothetical protein
MAVAGGFDLHRGQLTFDYVDTGTGESRRGRICPADRESLRGWLRRFDGVPRWAGRDAEGGPWALACGGPGGTVGVADGLLPGLSCGAAKYPAPGVTTRYWRQAWVRDADRSVQTQLREVHARSMQGIEERASCKGSSQTPGCVRYGPSGGPQTR